MVPTCCGPRRTPTRRCFSSRSRPSGCRSAKDVHAAGPDWLKRSAATHRRWKTRGGRKGSPRSCAGELRRARTRFDELLVDDDRDALEARVAAFIATKDVSGFARAFASEVPPKLEQRRSSGWRRSSVRGTCGRSCATGAPTRGGNAWCYVDRQLIPGAITGCAASSTHASRLKLVFNLRAPAGGARDRRARMRDVYRHSRAPGSCRELLSEPGATLRRGGPRLISAHGREFGDARGVRARRRASCPAVPGGGRPPSAPRARLIPIRRDDSGPRLPVGQCGLDCHGDLAFAAW